MRLTSLTLKKVKHRWRFLRACLEHLPTVEACLEHRPHIERLLEDHEFLRRCSEERDNLKMYFTNRFDLAQIAFGHGTMVFEVEKRLLQELVERSNALPGPIVEIGTLFGETTTRMALWKAPHKKIITVDDYSWNPWKISAFTHRSLTALVLKYVSEAGHVEIHCCDKYAFYRDYRGEPPSLVFFDADHTYEGTKADIDWARRIGAQMVSGHDYDDYCPGVMQAVDEAGGTVRRAGGVWALDAPIGRRRWEEPHEFQVAEFVRIPSVEVRAV